MARRKSRERVHGPYEHGRRWRIVVVDAGGRKDPHSYETKEEAERVKRSLERKLYADQRTVEKSIVEYRDYLKRVKGNRPTSIGTTESRLTRFFGEGDMPLARLTPSRCEGLYGKLTEALSVDSHRNTLAEVKTFFGWCVRNGWLAVNPVAKVSGTGRRRRGKEQLRIDEARKWQETAVRLADDGWDGAVAAMMALLMGMRASEIVQRIPRDLDDGGQDLWVTASKTEAGKRRLGVPVELRAYLLELAEGKSSNDLLFGLRDRGWPNKCVQRICREAEVPVVTAHGMRGLHSTLATDMGVTAHQVAKALGHESTKTTEGHYIERRATDEAKQERALHVFHHP